MTNPHPEANAPQVLAERLRALEELYMHLQQTVHELDQVLIAQGKQLASLEQQLGGATELIRALSSTAAGPPISPIDEKPPHY